MPTHNLLFRLYCQTLLGQLHDYAWWSTILDFQIIGYCFILNWFYDEITLVLVISCMHDYSLMMRIIDRDFNYFMMFDGLFICICYGYIPHTCMCMIYLYVLIYIWCFSCGWGRKSLSPTSWDLHDIPLPTIAYLI